LAGCVLCGERQGQAAVEIPVMNNTTAGRRSQSPRLKLLLTSSCRCRQWHHHQTSTMTTMWVVCSSTSVFTRMDNTCWLRGDTQGNCHQTTSTWLVFAWHTDYRYISTVAAQTAWYHDTHYAWITDVGLILPQWRQRGCRCLAIHPPDANFL